MSMKEQAYAYIDAHRDDMMKMWEDFVMTESGSANKADVDGLIACAADILTGMGGKTRIVEFPDAGNALVSEFGDCANKPFVVFVGHLDTVFSDPGETERRPFTIKDGRAYGPGVLDMKAGVTIAIHALQALKSVNYDKYAVKVILAGDEEVGHKHSNFGDTAMAEAKGAVAAFNFETGFMDDSLVLGRKGCYCFTMEAFGRGAHVGNAPQEGRSAIKELAYKILDIEALTDWSKGLNVGANVIEGGTVHNSAPAYAKITVDMRFEDPALLEPLKAKFKEINDKVYVDGVTCKMTPVSTLLPMVKLDSSMKLFELVKKVYEEEGFGSPKAITVGGASDSAFTTAVGVPTVCAMGVKGGRNHTVEEFADVESLFMRAKLICAVMLAL